MSEMLAITRLAKKDSFADPEMLRISVVVSRTTEMRHFTLPKKEWNTVRMQPEHFENSYDKKLDDSH